MRVGIYLARHAPGGGGIAVYAKSLVRASLELLSQHGYEDDEVVFYGSRSVLSDRILVELSLSPVLTAEAARLLDFGAGSYFRTLPNGARCRVLVRRLPEFGGRWVGVLIDQLLLPFWALIDRIALMHSVANYALALCPGVQLVTVHDLFQAWPVPVPAANKAGGQSAERLRANWRTHLYRLLFRAQFRTVAHVVVDARDTAEEIYRRFMFDPARVTVVPLGLDAHFERYLEQWRYRPEEARKRAEVWLVERGLPGGCVVVFASRDPRKNLLLTLDAWLELEAHERARGLVVHCPSQDVKRLVCRRLGAEAKGGSVHFIDWLEREELPELVANASVALVPTLAEGFGLPALEALSVGTRVVTGDVPSIADYAGEGVYLADPYDQRSITQALSAALADCPGPSAVGEMVWLEPGSLDADARRRPKNTSRTMTDAVQETWDQYRQVFVRHAGR